MMKRLWWMGILVAMIFLGWLINHFLIDGEPSYEGLTLTQWFKEDETHGLSTPSPFTDRYAAVEKAVKAIGTNGIPTFIKWVQAKDWVSPYAFRMLGAEGWPAVPTLVKLTRSKDREVRKLASECLAEIPHTIPMMIPDAD